MKRLLDPTMSHFLRFSPALRPDKEATKRMDEEDGEAAHAHSADSLTWFVASTEDEASDGHRVLYSGWDTEQYARNPQIDWAHASHPGLCGGRSGAPMYPIGSGARLRLNHEKRRLEVGVRWATGINPRTKQPYHRDAELVEYLVRDGFLNMVSVDFRMQDTVPLNQIDPTGAYARFRDEDASDWQMLSIRTRLFAIGVVPIGADDGAMAMGRTASERASAFARSWLDTDDGRTLLREFFGGEMRRQLETMARDGKIQIIGGPPAPAKPAPAKPDPVPAAVEEAESTAARSGPAPAEPAPVEPIPAVEEVIEEPTPTEKPDSWSSWFGGKQSA